MRPLSSLSENVFARVARLRHDRALHPRGTVTAATLQVDDPESALGAALGTGVHPARVRLSRGLGVPQPLPDVSGVAVRLDRGAGRVDLLFSGTPRHQSTLLPYRSGSGLLWLELERRSQTRFVLRERRLPRSVRTVGVLDIGEPTGDDGSPYDPYLHQAPGLGPVKFFSRIREAAYVGSRRGRTG
ncbi:hypothetical protein SAMN04487968_107110 [Nocardioides terrae]|uniref:Phosphodiesterase n=1 Tax=Nocardioides terrae TaxID=574651 RepID=A0A1I1JQN8_9ACTN|nr:hypothetical protein [Nocardioides terrae]SFC50884.1 hypothetical protein SAMN04487968_107110 [Nocardioides terrae]